MEINEESCKSFGNGGKVRKFWIITIEFRLKKKKQTQKNDLLTLTVSCEESCLIRRKKR